MKRRRVAAVGVLYFGMFALLFTTFWVLFLVIISGGPGWLIFPMIGVGVAALRVGDWWLPALRRLLKPDLPTVDAVEWHNANGRRAWQPETPDGRRQWKYLVEDHNGNSAGVLTRWETPDATDSDAVPARYRTRRRAAREAARHILTEQSHEWREA